MITEDTFPAFVKAVRRCMGWSVEDAARKLNISHRTIEGWEQGRVPPKPLIPFINIIIKETGIDPDPERWQKD